MTRPLPNPNKKRWSETFFNKNNFNYWLFANPPGAKLWLAEKFRWDQLAGEFKNIATLNKKKMQKCATYNKKQQQLIV